MKISEIEHSFNILIYGPPGSGKTHLAGSACEVPSMCPILWLDAEKGALTLRDAFPGHDDDFIYERATDYKVVNDAYYKIMRGDGKTYTDSDGNDRPWPKTVVIDNMSEVQKVAMRRIMEIVVRGDSDRDVEVPAQREWGKVLEQMRVMIRAYRDLEMNTVMTAWAYDEEDKGRRVTYPGLQGKMGKDIAGYIDIVGYLYTKTEDDKLTRTLLTESRAGVIAKSRGHALEPVLKNPTMAEIYKAVVG